MTTEYRLVCDHCDFTATTSAPQRAADGRVLSRRYCVACGAVRECRVGVQAAPRGPLGVPLGPRHGQASRLARGIAGRLRVDNGQSATSCTICGNETLLFPDAGQEPPCPQCRVGRLREQEAR